MREWFKKWWWAPAGLVFWVWLATQLDVIHQQTIINERVLRNIDSNLVSVLNKMNSN